MWGIKLSKKLWLYIVCVLIFLSLAIAADESASIAKREQGTKDVIPTYGPTEAGRYIIEFETEPLINTNSRKSRLKTASSYQKDNIQNEHAKFKSDILRLDKQAKTAKAASKDNSNKKTKEFKNVFNGIAVELTSQQLKEAKDLPYVKAIYKDETVTVNLMDSLDIINVPQVWNLTDGSGNNLTGKGMTIAIIDTGIDYTHPDLGGCFGAGCKIIGGYDVINDDADPFDDHGHGTHCAGIAAGNGTIEVEEDKILFEFDTFYDEFVEVATTITDGEVDIPILWGNGTYFTRIGDDNLNLVTSWSDSIQVNVSEDGAAFVASWNSSSQKESYYIGIQSIQDDEIDLRNLGSGQSRTLLKGQTWTLGNVQITLDYANGTEDIANLSINENGSFYRLYDINGNWIELPTWEEEELPTREYNMRVINSSGSYVALHEFYWSGYELKYYPPEEGPVDVNSIRGVAPDAELYAFKVLSSGGSGSWSDVIGGIERAVDPNNDGDFSDKVDVASMSLGGSGNPDDPVSLAVDNAVDAGVIFAISAGNSGPWASSIGSPGTARKAITVGATDKEDDIAGFSSRGPTSIGTVKPDVVAPGVSIYSSVPDDSCSLCDPSGYKPLSGTSMAAPHVAGAAALIKQAHPDWAPDDVKYALRNTAVDLGYDINTQGYGRIDVLKAVQLQNKPAIALLNTSGNMEPGAVVITGTAKGDNFDHYTIEFTEKDNISWSTSRIGLSNGGSLQVDNGVLGAIDLNGLDFGDFLLRLRVYTTDGNFSEDNTIIKIIYEDDYEPDDTYPEANTIAVGTETQVHTQFPYDDVDFVKFDANVGEMYFISAKRRTNDFYPMIEIYDSDGTTLLEEIYSYEGHWSPAVSGTYYISIFDFYVRYWGEEHVGVYDLTINSTVLNEDSYEPDNSIAEATFTYDWAYQQHNFFPANDVDFIEFNVTAGNYYMVRTSDGQIEPDPMVEIYDESGNLVRGADHKWFWYYKMWAPDENTTYYAKISDDDNIVGGEYTLDFYYVESPPVDSYEPDSDYTQATPIPTDGTVQTHTNSPAYDVDYIKFDAVAGNYYEIKTSNLVDADTFILLYDTDGTTVIAYNDDYFENDFASRIIWSPSVDGTYYVQIREYWEFMYGGSYDVSVNIIDASIDLKTYYLRVDGNANVNETSTVIASVVNNGEAISTNGIVSFYEYNRTSGEYIFIDSEPAGTLIPNYGNNIYFNWTPSRIGEYKLKAVAYDPDDIDHSNDDDYVWVDVATPGPDVHMQYPYFDDPTVVNETKTIEMEIENKGDETATNVYVDVYDIYDFEFRGFSVGSNEAFSYDGIEYDILLNIVGSGAAEVDIYYDGITENLVVYEYQAFVLSNGLTIAIDGIKEGNSLFFMYYGKSNKFTQNIGDLQPKDEAFASFDWAPDTVGDHTLAFSVFADYDAYQMNNGKVSGFRKVVVAGTNLEARIYLNEGVEEVIEAESFSDIPKELEQYKKDIFANQTVSIYGITTNQTYNLSIQIDNIGNEAANDVSYDIYYLHDYVSLWPSYNYTYYTNYNGTDYGVTIHMIDDLNSRINVTYGGITEVFELIEGQVFALSNGVLFDLHYTYPKYGVVSAKLATGTQETYSIGTINAYDRYEEKIEWEPLNPGQYLIKIFANASDEKDYENNKDYTHVDVGNFGVDVEIRDIEGNEMPMANMTHTYEIGVRTIGSEDAHNIEVGLYDETYDVLIDSKMVDYLAVDDWARVELNWTPTEIGKHNITFYANAENDTFNENDHYSYELYVREPVWVELDVNKVSITDWKGSTQEHYKLYDGCLIYISATPDSEVYFEVAVENKLDIGMDATIEAVIYDIDNGNDLSVTSDARIEANDEVSLVLDSLDIPLEVFEDDYYMEIWVTSTDDLGKQHETYWGLSLPVQKEMHDIRLTNLSIGPEVIEPGHSAEVNVSLINVGLKDESNVKISVQNTGLGIDVYEENITIGEIPYSGTNKLSKTYTINVPSGAAAGTYPISVSAYYDGITLSDSDAIELFVLPPDSPPQITSYSPTETEQTITENGQISFSVTAIDSEGTPSITWYVNDAHAASGQDYLFTASGAGDYAVKAVASDGENNATHSWTVHAYSRPIADTFDGSTTDFNALSDLQIANAYNVVLEKTAYGKIEFNSAVDLSDTLSLDDCVIINNDVVGIDNSCVPELNVPATITLYHVQYDSTPAIYYNNGFTPDAVDITTPCDFCNIINYTPGPTNDGTVKFTASHFTVFTIFQSGGTPQPPAGNSAPVANAGSDQTVSPGVLVTLTGATSYDVDGDPLNFLWSQMSGPSIVLSNTTAVSPTFTPTVEGTYVFQLTVNDGSLSGSDTVSITADDINLEIKNVEAEVDGEDDDVDDGDTIKEEARPGSTVEFEVEVENNFNDIDMEDVVVTVTIRDIDDGDDLEEEADDFDLDAGDDEKVDFSFDLPLLLDEDTYDVDILVEGEDESGTKHEMEWTVYLEVEKDKHDVIINDLGISPGSVKCDRSARVSVELVNIGSKDEDDVSIEIYSDELGISIEDRNIDIEEGSDDDAIYDRTFGFSINDDIAAGAYPIKVDVYIDDDKVESEVLNLAVNDCDRVSSTQSQLNLNVPNTAVTPTIPAHIMEPEQENVSFVDSDEYLMLMAIVFVLLLGGVIYLFGAVMILHNKKKRRF